MIIGNFLRLAACITAAWALIPAFAQVPVVSTYGPALVGSNPTAIAVNPVTRKVYVTNHDDNTVTILSLENQAAFPIATVPVGRQPNHVVVNTETDAVYVSNEGDGTMSVIDARTDQVRSSTIVVVGGAMTVNPNTNHMFMLRESPSDEFNILIGDAFLQASATRSYAPITLAMNPVTNRLFIGHEASTDVVPFNMNGDSVYPTRECPNGSGGLIPDSGQSNPDPRPCIDVPGYPVSVAVNPVTNRTYALTSTGEIAVIQGPNMTWSTFSLGGVYAASGPVAIAVNPVTNVIYALFQNKLVFIDGSNNQPFNMQSFDSPAVSLAVDIRRQVTWVATSGSKLFWLGGDPASGQQSGSAPIPAGARALDIDMLSGAVYVLSPSGVTSVTATNMQLRVASPITATIRPLPGNFSVQNGAITIDAASSMSPAPLDQVRAVFFRINPVTHIGSVIYRKASRNADGTWSATFAGLAPGNYRIDAFATNGLEMDSINTDKAQAPLTSAEASYPFSVGSSAGPNVTLVKAIQRFDLNRDGRSDLTWGNAGSKQSAGWLMNGTQIQAGLVVPQPNGLPNAVVVDRADFNGDGKSDLLWFDSGNGWFITAMDGLSESGASLALSVADGTYITHGNFDGDGKADLLVYSPSAGGYVIVNRATNPATVGPKLATAGLTDGAPILVADMDGDGIDDVLFLNSDGRKVFCGVVNGACATGGDLGVGGTLVAAADFNRDGKMDLVLDYGPQGQTKIRYSDGANYLADFTIVEGGSGWHVVAAPDMNGDGIPDLLWRRDDGSYAGWLMRGASAFAYKSFLGAGTGWEFKQAADLNGDGKVDLVWRHTDGRYGPWIMNGLDAFAYATFFGPGTGWEISP